MKYKDLLNQPDGVVFCEDDLPTPPLFIKLESLVDDILIEPVFDFDAGPRRLGWREMDECDLNSLDYYVLSQADLDGIVFKLTEN